MGRRSECQRHDREHRRADGAGLAEQRRRRPNRWRLCEGPYLAAAKKIEAVYEMPFLAHAAMEPMNCTVHVTKDSCDIWVGIQVVSRAQATAAQVTGLPPEKIQVHNHLIGGGFGRRLDVDGITQAVAIAKQVEGPVKIVWSREEDIQHDVYRPYYLRSVHSRLDAQGQADRLPPPRDWLPRSSRAGRRRRSWTVSTLTLSRARRSKCLRNAKHSRGLRSR